MFKTVLSWIIAIAVAILAIYLFFVLVGWAFKMVFWLIGLALVAVIAIPLYFYISKKLLK